jgi:hypothetical protein
MPALKLPVGIPEIDDEARLEVLKVLKQCRMPISAGPHFETGSMK